jgi:hypothetical protein
MNYKSSMQTLDNAIMYERIGSSPMTVVQDSGRDERVVMLNSCIMAHSMDKSV